MSVGPGVGSTSLHFDNLGSTVALANTRQTCATDLESCSDGFTFMLWLRVMEVASTSQVLQDGGLVIQISQESISVEYTHQNNLYSLTTGLGDAEKWTHVAVTFNNTVPSPILALYLDAVMVTSTTTSTYTASSQLASGQVILGNGKIVIFHFTYCISPLFAFLSRHPKINYKSLLLNHYFLFWSCDYNFLVSPSFLWFRYPFNFI